ncbi:hypothetical protein HAV15_002918 [Penicillium sp. str. |nr:hypothetical protein HAV15_002918 [Penicillium sp. str. \
MTTAWLLLSKSDFVNPDVLNAVNPHPRWGYVHGPIPDNNPDWKCERSHGIVTKREQARTLTIRRPQAPMVTLNRYNTFICDISVHDARMCGINFNDNKSLTRHIRTVHPGAAKLPLSYQVTTEEKISGNNAMKRWVLMGGWRDALYLNEPSRKNVSVSLLGYYCDVLEGIARTDAQFAAEYGTKFHRPGHREWLESGVPGIYLPPDKPMPLTPPSIAPGDESGKPSRCERSTRTEPVSDNDADANPDFTSGSASAPDCEIVSKSASEVDSEPEDQEEWPVDAVTDIFAGMYLPSSKLDAAYGPISEEMD